MAVGMKEGRGLALPATLSVRMLFRAADPRAAALQTLRGRTCACTLLPVRPRHLSPGVVPLGFEPRVRQRSMHECKECLDFSAKVDYLFVALDRSKCRASRKKGELKHIFQLFACRGYEEDYR